MIDPIEFVAHKIAVKVKEWNPDILADTDDIRFGAAYYINYYSVIVVSLIIGLYTKQLLNTALALISLAIIRKYTGGLHFKSLTICAVVTIMTMSLIPHIQISDKFTLLLNVSSLLLVAISKNGLSNEKKISAMLVMSNIVYGSPVIALSFFVQAIQLIRSGR